MERAGVSRFEAVTDAVTFLNWCVGETARGRVILSMETDGTNMTRLTHPVIEAVRQNRQNWLPR
jgi:hypothetical protein